MIRKIQRLITDKYYRFGILQSKGFFKRMDDKKYLEMMYQFKLGKPLDLERPRTFNEKLQWLKLYDRNPMYIQMVDKCEVKKLVANIIGEEYIIPTLGVWDSFEDIDFSKLPNQFVLKCTHDSGGLVIVKDKSEFNKKKAKTIINKSLKRNFYYYGREWPYKDVKPRVIAEQYMEDERTQDLPDYKIHNFGGVPKVILLCRNRYKEQGLTEDFFTDNWTHLNVKRPNHENANIVVEAPPALEKMLDLAKKLSKNIPFLRTDFYIINGKVYFGELTFFPASGFDGFDPSSFDSVMGEWIKIDGESQNKRR